MARYGAQRTSMNADVGEPKTSDRHPVRDKKKSARKFGQASQRTKALNVAPAPMRGGIRL